MYSLEALTQAGHVDTCCTRLRLLVCSNLVAGGLLCHMLQEGSVVVLLRPSTCCKLQVQVQQLQLAHCGPQHKLLLAKK